MSFENENILKVDSLASFLHLFYFSSCISLNKIYTCYSVPNMLGKLSKGEKGSKNE